MERGGRQDGRQEVDNPCCPRAPPTASPDYKLPPWARLSQAEVQRCLHTCESLYGVAYRLTTPQQMQSVFSPLYGSHSSGLLSVDALLARAANVHSSPSHTENEDSTTDVDQRDLNTGVSGWVSGTMNEIYGAPMSGKSFLLQQTAKAFVRKQMMMATTPMLLPTAKQDNSRSRGNESCGERRVNSWDVYVCLLCPSYSVNSDSNTSTKTGREHDSPHTPSCTAPVGSTASEASWAQVIRDAIQDVKQANGRNDNVKGNELETEDRYAREHVHVVSVAHPNELLAFLQWLGDSLDSLATSPPPPSPLVVAHKSAGLRSTRAGGKNSIDNESTGTQRARGNEGRGLSRSCTPTPAMTIAETVEKKEGGGRKRQRDASEREERSASPSPASENPQRRRDASPVNHHHHHHHPEQSRGEERSAIAKEPLSSRERNTLCCRHHQVLLLIDSLTSVWSHPSLQGSQHALRWYSAELQRLLRRCLCRRGSTATVEPREHKKKATAPGPPFPPSAACTVSTTALVTNGSSLFSPAGMSVQRRQSASSPLLRNALRAATAALPSFVVSVPGEDHSKVSHSHNNNNSNSNGASSKGGRQLSPPTTRAAFYPFSFSSPPPASRGPACSTSHRNGKVEAKHADAMSEEIVEDAKPYPLGDETWLRFPDLRLWLQPADHRLLSLPAQHGRPHGTFSSNHYKEKGPPSDEGDPSLLQPLRSPLRGDSALRETVGIFTSTGQGQSGIGRRRRRAGEEGGEGSKASVANLCTMPNVGQPVTRVEVVRELSSSTGLSCTIVCQRKSSQVGRNV